MQLERLGPRAVVISSVHDYRTGRRGTVQWIAEAIARAGYDATFLSIRFSPLSLLKRDPRAFLWNAANRSEAKDNIKCYLWRTPFHPVATGGALGDRLIAPLHDLYGVWPSADVDAMLRGASLILVESGMGVLLLARARRLNPQARLIYLASDTLQLIGAHPALQQTLERAGGLIDRIFLRAHAMAPDFAWAAEKTFFLPVGAQPVDARAVCRTPYRHALNAVSVGSMLFDPHFFEIACAAFPQMQFHVIGADCELPRRANLHVYGEMPFERTLPFIANASIGVAPYRRSDAQAAYLAESSLKLAQYEYLRLPAVCPNFATGGRAHRFGYEPADALSILAAVNKALQDGYEEAQPRTPSWDDVLQRLLDPERHPDTHITPAQFQPATAPHALQDTLS